ncbi:MAG: sugar ABC transporter permease [Phycisphaerales bacterium]
MRSGLHIMQPTRQRWAGLLWVSPWLLGLLLFFAVPMAMSLYYSTTEYTMLESPLGVGLENYSSLLRDPVFHRTIVNTLIYAAFVIPLSIILALAIAGLLDFDSKLSHFVRLLVFAPTVVPLVASAMIWLWLFNGENGLINTGLAVIGLSGPNWLQEQGFAMAALVVMALWSIGQPVVIYLAALQDVPKHLYEAGELDGMGPLRKFVHVAMPSIAPAIFFNTIIQTITAWQVFAAPYIMTEGGPDRSTYFYSHYLYDNAFLYQRMGYASAMAWVQLMLIGVCILGIYAVTRRLWNTER